MAEGTRTLPRGVREGFGVEATFVVGEERGNLTFGGHSGMPHQHGQSLGKLEALGGFRHGHTFGMAKRMISGGNAGCLSCKTN